MSGIYRSTKVDGGVGSSEIILGGRYALDPEEKEFWFFQATINQTSYSGDGAPDNSTGFQLGGGKKYLLNKLGKRFTPYLSWTALIISSEEGNGNTTTETSGILYGGQAGIRMLFSPDIFMELEAPLFTSALSATTTETTTDATTGTSTENKTSRTDLYVQSFGSMNDVIVSLGYKL